MTESQNITLTTLAPGFYGISFIRNYPQIPRSLKNAQTAWSRRLYAAGIRADDAYYCSGDDVETEIDPTSRANNKGIFVSVKAWVEMVPGSVASIVYPDGTKVFSKGVADETEMPPLKQVRSVVVNRGSVEEVLLKDWQLFVDAKGNMVIIRIYGSLNDPDSLWFNLSDVLKELDPRSRMETVTSSIVQVNGQDTRVMTMDAMLALVYITKNPRAGVIRKWATHTIFNAQFHPETPIITQAEHVATKQSNFRIRDYPDWSTTSNIMYTCVVGVVKDLLPHWPGLMAFPKNAKAIKIGHGKVRRVFDHRCNFHKLHKSINVTPGIARPTVLDESNRVSIEKSLKKVYALQMAPFPPIRVQGDTEIVVVTDEEYLDLVKTIQDFTTELEQAAMAEASKFETERRMMEVAASLAEEKSKVVVANLKLELGNVRDIQADRDVALALLTKPSLRVFKKMRPHSVVDDDDDDDTST